MVMMIPFIEHINFYEWLKFRYLNGESIPDEYLPIQYIQCTGIQYIDTGLKYDKPYYYIVDCSIDDYNGCQVFGMNVNYDHGVDVYNGYYQLLDSRYNIYDTTIPAGTRATFTIDQPTKTIYADSGSIHESYTSPGDFFPTSSVYPVLLGAIWNSYNDSLYAYGMGKIYGFKYYENGELLRDMIPVIRLSDYKPGMYDKVTQTFFTNQGTGEFENPIYGYLSGNPPFTFNSNGNPLVDYIISGNTTQNGTPTPDSPIMPQGTGERTANLFDASQISWKNAVKNDVGAETASELSHYTTNFTEVKSETTYCLGGNLGTEGQAHRIYFYDENKAWLSCSSSLSYSVSTFTTPINCKYVQFQVQRYISGISWMLVEGSTALPYEPYGYKIPISSANTTTNIYLGEVQTTRKVKKLVFDGTENWTNQTLNRKLISIAKPSGIPAGSINLLSTHFIITSSNNVAVGKFYAGGSWLNFNYDNNNDLDAWKTFLTQQYAAGTPVTVWYVLANEETGIVNEPLHKIGDYADTLSMERAGVEIPTINGSNALTVDTTLQPSEVSIVYKK